MARGGARLQTRRQDFAVAPTKNPEIYPSVPFLLNGDGSAFFLRILPGHPQKLGGDVIFLGGRKRSLLDDLEL